MDMYVNRKLGTPISMVDTGDLFVFVDDAYAPGVFMKINARPMLVSQTSDQVLVVKIANEVTPNVIPDKTESCSMCGSVREVDMSERAFVLATTAPIKMCLKSTNA